MGGLVVRDQTKDFMFRYVLSLYLDQLLPGSFCRVTQGPVCPPPAEQSTGQRCSRTLYMGAMHMNTVLWTFQQCLDQEAHGGAP